ncbi:hypothetical protein G352_24006 [Rhodococcus ruber BKS 20-38]|uniref:Uncharacterized protein n=1 Tax=Rhodococcus ruber BKS 20-38 TaxID=1278076 RepID=M2YZH4_9NOCA|nr:hypothetical protein G352_24006 [Rhodococcus ruber BKS 20-38]
MRSELRWERQPIHIRRASIAATPALQRALYEASPDADFEGPADRAFGHPSPRCLQGLGDTVDARACIAPVVVCVRLEFEQDAAYSVAQVRVADHQAAPRVPQRLHQADLLSIHSMGM